jgi:hypothetical protein
MSCLGTTVIQRGCSDVLKRLASTGTHRRFELVLCGKRLPSERS